MSCCQFSPGVWLASRFAVVAWSLIAIGCTWESNEPAEDEVPTAQIVFPDDPLETPAWKISRMRPASESRLKDSDEVIGVIMQGQPAAYSLTRMSDIRSHLALDELSGERRLITFCDRTQCIRVFEAEEYPLEDFVLRGWKSSSMRIEIAGQEYDQLSEQVPLTAIPSTRTTWGEWRTAHPTTTIFD